MFMHVGNHACKRVDVHLTNNNLIWQKKMYEISINPWQLKTTSLFQSCVLLLSYRLYYFSLHDDYTPFLYTKQPIYRAALSFLINWNEKQCTESNILTMEHELFLENSSSANVNTLSNTIIHLKATKYLNIRLRKIY